MRVSRADRSRLSEWWFTVDHVLIVAIIILMSCGLVLSLAASPAVAMKKSLPTFFFFERHVFFTAVGFCVMITLSFLTPPVGFALFYLKGVCPPDVKLTDIYRGVVPFIIIQLIALTLVIVFPTLAVWLPSIAYN